MRKLAVLVLTAAALGALFAALASRGGSPSVAQASSHREAPLISEDPSADNTDTYAFRSPDRPDTVSIISNYIPGEDPAAGPNWYTFSPSARYVVYADKNGDGKADVTWRFRFKNQAPVAFLQNTQQSYTVTKVTGRKSSVVGNGLLTPPDNIGPRSTPNYHALATAGVHQLGDGTTVRGSARRRVLRRHRRGFRPCCDSQRHRCDRRRQGLLRRVRGALHFAAGTAIPARQRR